MATEAQKIKDFVKVNQHQLVTQASKYHNNFAVTFNFRSHEELVAFTGAFVIGKLYYAQNGEVPSTTEDINRYN